MFAVIACGSSDGDNKGTTDGGTTDGGTTDGGTTDGGDANADCKAICKFMTDCYLESGMPAE